MVLKPIGLIAAAVMGGFLLAPLATISEAERAGVDITGAETHGAFWHHRNIKKAALLKKKRKSSVASRKANKKYASTKKKRSYAAAKKNRKYASVKKNRKRTSVARYNRVKRGGGKASGAIVAMVKSHARQAGVPATIALAVVRQESGFRPGVTGGAGEIGLMQIKCQTARGMGYRGSCRGLYNPSTNLRYGMRYLRMALNRGSVGYYNAGIYAKRLPYGAKRYAASVRRNAGRI